MQFNDIRRDEKALEEILECAPLISDANIKVLARPPMGSMSCQATNAAFKGPDSPQVETQGPWCSSGGPVLPCSSLKLPQALLNARRVSVWRAYFIFFDAHERLNRLDLILKNGLSLTVVLSISSAPGEALRHPSDTNVIRCAKEGAVAALSHPCSRR